MAELSPRQRALADYAVKLTKQPQQCGSDDLDRLRAHGLSDKEILEASHVVGFFNHINRLADALGVDLEPEMPRKKV